VKLLQVMQAAITPTYGWRSLRDLFDVVLAQLSGEDGQPEPSRVPDWLKVMDSLALAAEHVGESQQALSAHEAALQARRTRVANRLVAHDEADWTAADRDDLRSLAVGLNNAAPSFARRRFEDGMAAAAEAGSLARRLGDQRLRANALLQQGVMCLEADIARHSEVAERALDEGLAVAQSLGDRPLIGKFLTERATLAYERGLLETGDAQAQLFELALGGYRQALDFTPPDNIGGRAIVFYQAALVRSALGEVENARRTFETAIRLYQQNGAARQASETQLVYARFLASHNLVLEACGLAEAAAEWDATRARTRSSFWLR
jgi:tetratricopeptide (TPR) repeat protein